MTTRRKTVKAWVAAYLQDRNGGEGYILEHTISTQQRECRERMARVFSDHPNLWYEFGWKRAYKNKVRVLPCTISFTLPKTKKKVDTLSARKKGI
jgi:hypothetical protein